MKFKKKSSIAVRFDTLSISISRSVISARSNKWGSTFAKQVAFCSGLALAAHAQAQSGMASDEGPRYPTATPPASSSAPMSASDARRAQSSTDVFVANAPDTYTIVRGDTLWGIAGRFLKQPWRWPQIWQMNRDQIRNPHWIYPGQVIVLDRTTGTMRLGTGPNANGTVKLSPQVRVEPGRDAIPSIPPEAIEPYLTQPLIVETSTMLDSPRVVASKERVVLGVGDIAYVSGITDPSVTTYQLFRPGRALKDPDTGEVIAYQADYLGTANVTRPGSPATVAITSSKMEIGVGDRLVPASKAGVINYMPHAPAQPLSGRIIATYSGVAYAGTNMIVAINRGSAEGLDIGAVLAIKTFGRTIVDKTNGTRESITLPEERKGLLFVFRVFNHVAYGLITSSAEPVEVGDTITQP
jgi:hypothetical protein